MVKKDMVATKKNYNDKFNDDDADGVFVDGDDDGLLLMLMMMMMMMMIEMIILTVMTIVKIILIEIIK